MNAHFLLKSDKSFWQSLLSNAEDYELLVVKKFDDTCSVHKKSSSVSNCSMISCSRLVDFNPTFGIHPNMVEYCPLQLNLGSTFWRITK